MAWSSTTVDVSHIHPSLMCVRGSHVCASKPVCCWKLSKPLGVGMFRPLGVFCKRRWERGMALGMMSLHSNHLTHAWWYNNTVCHATPCIFLFSEPRMEQCCSQTSLLCLWCQCFHVQSNCLGKHLPQCFHEFALKVHMVHCDSLATLAPVCWLCMKRNLVCNAP